MATPGFGDPTSTSSGVDTTQVERYVPRNKDEALMFCSQCRRSLQQCTEPRLLPCLHAVCLDCLSSRSTGGVVRCCVCSKLSRVSESLSHFLFLASSSDAQMKCTNCAEANLATCHCYDCQEPLCDACAAAHKRVKLTKEHRLESLAPNFQDVLRCRDHPSEMRDICCATCDALTCRNCVLEPERHRGHTIHFVRELAPEARNAMAMFVDQSRERLQNWRNAGPLVRKRLQDVDEQEKQMKMQLRQKILALQQMVTQRGNDLLTHIQHVCNAKREFYSSTQANLQQALIQLEQVYYVIEAVGECTSDAVVLMAKPPLVSQAAAIGQMNIDINQLQTPVNIRIDMDVAPLEKELAHFGRIMVGSLLCSEPLANTTVARTASRPSSGDSVQGRWVTPPQVAPVVSPSQIHAPTSAIIGPSGALCMVNAPPVYAQPPHPIIMPPLVGAPQIASVRSMQQQIVPAATTVVAAPRLPPLRRMTAVRNARPVQASPVYQRPSNSIASSDPAPNASLLQQMIQSPVYRAHAGAMRLSMPVINCNQPPGTVRASLAQHIQLLQVQRPPVSTRLSADSQAATGRTASPGTGAVTTSTPIAISVSQNDHPVASEPIHLASPNRLRAASGVVGTVTQNMMSAGVQPTTRRQSEGAQFETSATTAIHKTPSVPVITNVCSLQATSVASPSDATPSQQIRAVAASRSPPAETCHHIDTETAVIDAYPATQAFGSVQNLEVLEQAMFVRPKSSDCTEGKADSTTRGSYCSEHDSAEEKDRVPSASEVVTTQFEECAPSSPGFEVDLWGASTISIDESSSPLVSVSAIGEPKRDPPKVVLKLKKVSSSSRRVDDVDSLVDSTSDELPVAGIQKHPPVSEWHDWCEVCHDGGELVLCENCPRVFHAICHIPAFEPANENDPFFCNMCRPESERVPISRLPGVDIGTLSEHERRMCQYLLLCLYCQDDSACFHYPVDVSTAPQYLKIIRQPMDFGTIRSRLNPGAADAYSSVQQFISDLNLVFLNCDKYNERACEVWQFGRLIGQYYMQLVKQYLPAYVGMVKVTRHPGDRPSRRSRSETPTVSAVTMSAIPPVPAPGQSSSVELTSLMNVPILQRFPVELAAQDGGASLGGQATNGTVRKRHLDDIVGQLTKKQKDGTA